MSGFALFAFLGSLIGGAALDSYEARKGRERLEAFKKTNIRYGAAYSVHDAIRHEVRKAGTNGWLPKWLRENKYKIYYTFSWERNPAHSFIMSKSPLEINWYWFKENYSDFIDDMIRGDIVTKNWEKNIKLTSELANPYRDANVINDKIYIEVGRLILAYINVWCLQMKYLIEDRILEFTDFKFSYEDYHNLGYIITDSYEYKKGLRKERMERQLFTLNSVDEIKKYCDPNSRKLYYEYKDTKRTSFENLMRNCLYTELIPELKPKKIKKILDM